MNRVIKFRGLRVDGEGWLYGDLTRHNEQTLISPEWDYPNQWDDTDMNVIPESVGQFTGVKDSKGTEIYVGDIIECNGKCGFPTIVFKEDTPYLRRVCFTQQGFTSHRLLGKGGEFDDNNFSSSHIVSNYQLYNKHSSLTVVGNIYEEGSVPNE